MMQQRTIVVQLFAGARAAVGADRCSVTVAPGATVRDLRAALSQAFPALTPLLTASRFAVETGFLVDEQPLNDTAVVAWIPPVSGG